MIETRLDFLSNPEGAVHLQKETLFQGSVCETHVYRIGIETGGFVKYIGKISKQTYEELLRIGN